MLVHEGLFGEFVVALCEFDELDVVCGGVTYTLL